MKKTNPVLSTVLSNTIREEGIPWTVAVERVIASGSLTLRPAATSPWEGWRADANQALNCKRGLGESSEASSRGVRY